MIKINPGTKEISPGLQPGMRVTVTAEIDDDQLVAKSILITTVSDGTGTPTATPTATATTTLTATPTGTLTMTTTPAGSATAACGSGNTQPVAQRLADGFVVSYDEIVTWHCKGFGFGEIARAYLFAQEMAKSDHALTVEQIFAMQARAGGIL